MLTVGSEGLYEWLVTDQQFGLLEICPEIVLGKYVALTSIDSGSLVPSEKETADGWQSRGKVAYSPQIRSVAEIPSAGWDEWYVFIQPVDLGISHLEENIFEVPHEPGHVNVFVNYGFALHPTDGKDLTTLFWQQMSRVRPESYMADNDSLTFVSGDKALFASVLDAVKARS